MARRGLHIAELNNLGNSELRQIYSQGFRVVYQTTRTSVSIMAILHERQDLAAVLNNRLAP